MKRIILLAALAVCGPAFAGGGMVEQAQCSQIARNGSAGGAVIGTALGAAIGEGIADYFGLGKAGRLMGTALGGVGGAAAGESVAATHTYECLLSVQHEGNLIVTKVVSNKQYSVGQSVVVTAMSDGSFHVR